MNSTLQNRNRTNLERVSTDPLDTFPRRHIGPDSQQVDKMLKSLGLSSLEELVDKAVPAGIRLKKEPDLPKASTEHKILQDLKNIASQNQIFRSYIGAGYNACIIPGVIQRNILENPGWYTAYTPYQAEISQGRLEALLNFQTMIIDLTGLEISNASLLDEGTAAAEAMFLAYSIRKNEIAKKFFVSELCHPQTIDVVVTRANPLGIEIVIGNHESVELNEDFFGVLLQYPATDGKIIDYTSFIQRAHNVGAISTVAADLLALTLLKSPGEMGADIAVGSSQRFGLPLGFGGPHAGYFATKDEFKRSMPGRLIGVSKDSQGNPGLRLSLQTREQHIRRDKATSNICTAQVLLAVISSMYAVYHGPEGLKDIATRIHKFTSILADALKSSGFTISNDTFFDTITIQAGAKAKDILNRARSERINLREYKDGRIGIALDETVNSDDIKDLFKIFEVKNTDIEKLFSNSGNISDSFKRSTSYLTHPVFQSFHTETKMLRYIRKLESRDLSLTTSMIPLGSCTMKLNATTEMYPVTWPEFGAIHPFAPSEQTKGYKIIFEQLEKWLCEITGFAGVSLQPNAGSQGEYAGLLAIRRYHESRKETHRNVCLIPISAHGTNPASAAMAGFKVVVVSCDQNGNVDLEDLKIKAEEHKNDLAALMITYPSTHGVFEESVKEICQIVHSRGGQVYMDGANMNAQVGLTSPGEIGADVCHLNLHKTFCIPHGGGGPGVGPIGVAKHLVPFLPGHVLVDNTTGNEHGAVSAAPWGSASIVLISWIYIALMGSEGLTNATRISILNANYIAKRLEKAYPVLYKGKNGFVAHECILDVRPFKKSAEIEVEDVAKRLIDYGFHAPTMSFPVPGTLMIEPTESESLEELDRFCEAMLLIHQEILDVQNGTLDKIDNPLKNSPHTAAMTTSDRWDHLYPKERAAYPAPWSRDHKFWPFVGRVDNVYGDRNLVCSCLPVESYQ
ncbi:aminomethyl-transferring glycine dehydrogenase [Leptospira borgpetersenii]|uniref:Glycine dehydrogenase (decarboxylating) n=3 Tax=Leptospira borgpetersenii serovar Hardjo-bovis TaxID=338217 RepID=GCSP_LEPBJ|nr:aminomethyl-transferring glycine dehydrogenase [Leptospira borgpetersenii]Q04PM7.1 RecName: Full=Glycine dehydrogenase (decarboxylating); AltName: Full=Glycine cleavage system P-protein; AltName: Full=Glycine decarboxylase; AltName: Full=Glycine dehydrogenase (aminomethyl-transferring) [Leptospira borgpetersenii serovar Hardjo-bovis str. JB197]Q055P8.1 RecName: Full=Glycine dehydrogenase (decarboxylating); AltName: Full=Glycine cleavage system P-protein; AltName: Full=Glycine decarboxylase; Al